MRDQHIAQEVLVWKCIAKAWADYKGREAATDDEAVKCITALSLITMDFRDAKHLKVQEGVAERLVECFDRVWNERQKR